jgi:hypothetical protein
MNMTAPCSLASSSPQLPPSRMMPIRDGPRNATTGVSVSADLFARLAYQNVPGRRSGLGMNGSGMLVARGSATPRAHRVYEPGAAASR